MCGLNDSKEETVRERKELVEVATEYYTKLFSEALNRTNSLKRAMHLGMYGQGCEALSTETDEDEEQEKFPPNFKKSNRSGNSRSKKGEGIWAG